SANGKSCDGEATNPASFIYTNRVVFATRNDYRISQYILVNSDSYGRRARTASVPEPEPSESPVRSHRRDLSRGPDLTRRTSAAPRCHGPRPDLPLRHAVRGRRPDRPVADFFIRYPWAPAPSAPPDRVAGLRYRRLDPRGLRAGRRLAAATARHHHPSVSDRRRIAAVRHRLRHGAGMAHRA